MTIDVQDAESGIDTQRTVTRSREERRSAIVLLVCVMVTIAMIGLLVDSFTDSIRVSKPIPVRPSAVPLPGAKDDFARADSVQSLGDATSGQAWRAVTGRWGIASGQARVVVAAPQTSLAMLAVGVPDGRVQVTFAHIAAGAGLVFRCRNAGNCWRVEVVPQLGTWNVVKEVRYKETTVTNLGVVPVADGTTVAVDMNGTKLSFLVDGKVAKTIDDGALALETEAGLSLRAPAGATVARWSSFSMTPHPAPGRLSPTDATVYDDFARTDSTGLGATGSGRQWSVVSGGWSVTPGMAASSAPAAGGASLALVDLGSADGVVQTTMLAPQQRSGLAFRCEDVDNCWRLEAVLGYATWNIYRIVDGRVSLRGNLGIVSTAPETTVSVDMEGAHLSFYINGAKVRALTDKTFENATRAGLVVEPGPFSASTRWSNFAARPGAHA